MWCVVHLSESPFRLLWSGIRYCYPTKKIPKYHKWPSYDFTCTVALRGLKENVWEKEGEAVIDEGSAWMRWRQHSCGDRVSVSVSARQKSKTDIDLWLVHYSCLVEGREEGILGHLLSFHMCTMTMIVWWGQAVTLRGSSWGQDPSWLSSVFVGSCPTHKGQHYNINLPYPGSPRYPKYTLSFHKNISIHQIKKSTRQCFTWFGTVQGKNVIFWSCDLKGEVTTGLTWRAGTVTAFRSE